MKRETLIEVTKTLLDMKPAKSAIGLLTQIKNIPDGPEVLRTRVLDVLNVLTVQDLIEVCIWSEDRE